MYSKVLVFSAILSAVSALALDPPKDIDIGVYLTDGSEWVEAPVEIVNWKTGGVVKHVLTDGIIKGDLNGRIRGDASPVGYPGTAKIEVLIHTMEGTAAEEYQLLRLRPHSDAREFRSVTGGVFHASGGAERDLVPFKAVRVAPRLWRVELHGLPQGEYGLLPPVNTASLAASGKIYTFKIGDCERCESPRDHAENHYKTTAKSLFLLGKDPALDF